MPSARLARSALGRLQAARPGPHALPSRSSLVCQPHEGLLSRLAKGKQPQRPLHASIRRGLSSVSSPSPAGRLEGHKARGLATVVSPQRSSTATEPSVAAPPSSSLETQILQLRALQNLFDSIDDPIWRARLAATIERLERRVSPEACPPLKVLIAGSSLSRTEELLLALFDEPLRDHTNAANSDASVLKQAIARSASGGSSVPLTIAYGQGPAIESVPHRMTIDRGWLLDGNVQITVLLDPSPSVAVEDHVYGSDAVFLVADTYALEQCLARSDGFGSPRLSTLDLVSWFSSKPNTHLIVNQLTDMEPSDLSGAVETAIGSAAFEQLSHATSNPFIFVSSKEAIEANVALRNALTGGDGAPSQSSSTPWDEFSRGFTVSKVADIQRRIQSLAAGQASGNEATQLSAQVVIDHCLSDLMSLSATASVCFDQLLAASAALQTEIHNIEKQAKNRVWPSSTLRRPADVGGKLKVWRPSAAGSSSAVEDALDETAEAIASTMDRRLQWWKLVWKADDIRSELEGVCSSFAHSLESTLAYESGRLATLQSQQIGVVGKALDNARSISKQVRSLPGTSKDVALFINEAEAIREREKVLTPTTLLEPIESRRAQLLSAGGPIDVLASAARRLAVTTYAALAATAAGLGSASITGASLGAGALSLEPSTALATAVLICTAAAWRVQGRFAKIKSRFWQDWDRLAEGLDFEVKEHLEVVIRRDVVGQSTFVATGLHALKNKWQRKVSSIEEAAHAADKQISVVSTRGVQEGLGPVRRARL